MDDNPDLMMGADGLARPRWATSSPVYQHYYDTEWGMPVTDERGILGSSGVFGPDGRTLSP